MLDTHLRSSEQFRHVHPVSACASCEHKSPILLFHPLPVAVPLADRQKKGQEKWEKDMPHGPLVLLPAPPFCAFSCVLWLHRRFVRVS